MENYQVFSEDVARKGRHVNHDERSKAYAFDGSGVTVKSVRHPRYIPVLDQGQLGSCTGNAMTGLLGTGDFWFGMPIGVLSPSDAVADEKVAVDLYSLATTLDGYRGHYPPDDTGSDGLSVAKAAQKSGWISGYQHTFDFNTFLAALTLQPVIVGVSWYSSFDTPNANGLITLPAGATVEGGHEFVVDELDVENKRIGFTNSWATDWGLQGRAYIGYADFEKLLANDGDVTVPVALTKPAPTPTPPPGPTPGPTPNPTPGPVNPLPTPDPNDVALWADMQKWAKLKGLSS
jgi:hypothetical protein